MDKIKNKTYLYLKGVQLERINSLSTTGNKSRCLCLTLFQFSGNGLICEHSGLIDMVESGERKDHENLGCGHQFQ